MSRLVERMKGWASRLLDRNPFMVRWKDGRQRFFLCTRLGLPLWLAKERAIIRWRLPLKPSVTVDCTWRVPERDDVLIKEVLHDYELALEQARRRQGNLPLSPQWLDYTSEVAAHLRADLLHDFRRNRLGLYGFGVGGVLEENPAGVKLTFSGNYTLSPKAILQGERSAREFALDVATYFHRIGHLIDPGILATATEDPIGGPIVALHQGRRLTRNLLRFEYMLTNVMRRTDLPLTAPITVCEIGGGYGGFAKVFKTVYPRATFLIFDLPESLALSAFYLRSNYPRAQVATIRDFPSDEALEVERLAGYDFVILPWWYVEKLPEKSIDLFFNSVSMQEMTHEFVVYWVGHIQKAARGYFYWVNRWRAPSRYGGVRFDDYPLDDQWRTVYTRQAYRSPVSMHEWMAQRTF